MDEVVLIEIQHTQIVVCRWAVAPTAGTVLREFAADGVAGKGGKQHRAPTSEVRLPAGTNSVKRAQRTNYVQKRASKLTLEDKKLKINNLNLVEAAGVEPASEIVVNRETPCVVAFL